VVLAVPDRSDVRVALALPFDEVREGFGRRDAGRRMALEHREEVARLRQKALKPAKHAILPVNDSHGATARYVAIAQRGCGLVFPIASAADAAEPARGLVELQVVGMRGGVVGR